MSTTSCGCGHSRYQHLNDGDWCKAPLTGPGPRCTCMRFTTDGEPPRSEAGPVAYFLGLTDGRREAGPDERRAMDELTSLTEDMGLYEKLNG